MADATPIVTLEAASGDEAQALRAEIARLNKIIEALMNRAERSTSARGSDFSLFQTAIMLEEQVRRRTADLEAALCENEKVNRALQLATARMEQEIERRKQIQDALHQSEQRYRTATESALDAFITIDQDNRIVFVNPAVERFFGYRADELVGQDIGILMPPHMRARHAAGMTRYLSSGERRVNWQGVEITCMQREGRQFPLEFSFGEFEHNGRRYFTGVARDISERKRAEALREGQTRVLEMIALDSPLQESLLALLRCVEAQDTGILASVLLLDEDGRHVREAISPSLALDYLASLRGLSVGPAAGSCGTAMHRREPVVVTDIQTDPLWREYQATAAEYGLRACWSRPIFSGNGSVLGAFALYYREPRAPTDAEHKLIDLAVRIAGIAIERKQSEVTIRHMAHHDVLTGLPNRVLLEDRLQQAIMHANRHRMLVAVLFVDLDHFKHVNDSLGHHVGDLLLRAAAKRMQACVRDADSIARLGGDEFVIELSEIRRKRDAAAVAEKIQEALTEPFSLEGHVVQIGCSIGISLYPLDGKDASTLLKAADAAMYDAKGKGRANFQFFTAELNLAAQQRMVASHQLRLALSRQELVLHYQPQVSLRTGAIVGAEALIRWQHPLLGLVPPEKFIAILEEIGLMGEIGAWVLRSACAQCVAWQQAGLPPVRISVNLSPRQFSGGDIVHTVGQVLQETGLSPEWLELEITESLILDNSERVIQAMHDLKGMGVALALDDFGTGYSSLSYLRRFPVDRLKIDRSFVQDVTSNASAADIVGSILALAHKLGLGTVAEGVETEAQLGYLCRQGCAELQGYLFSLPLPAPQMTELLHTDRRLALLPALGRASHTLLLVDDDPLIAGALQRTLRREGLHVLHATTTEQAFELLARQQIGVIMADLNPGGADGIDFLGRTKALHPEAIRILLAGRAEMASVANAINKGAIYKLLVKPWDDVSLIENIREAFALYKALEDSVHAALQAGSGHDAAA